MVRVRVRVRVKVNGDWCVKVRLYEPIERLERVVFI